jgi:hypothetical protein
MGIITPYSKKEYMKTYYIKHKNKWFSDEAIEQRKEYEKTEKYKEIKKNCDSKRYYKNKNQTSESNDGVIANTC